MILVSADVGPFRSINKVQQVKIDPTVTVLVGMNEAGKTVFLKALQKARDATGVEKFDPIEDYPRRELPRYLKFHETKPADVVRLKYALKPEELSAIDEEYHTKLPDDFSFSLNHRYNNTSTISIDVDERPVLDALASSAGLSGDAANTIRNASSIKEVPEALKALSLSENDKTFLAALEQRVAAAASARWSNVIGYELWHNTLSKQVPEFLYFGDYDLLPSKMNLADLAQRVAQASQNPGQKPSPLQPEHRGVLALLRMASVSLSDFNSPTQGYEPLKAKLEGVSISLTDQIMQFWKQNEDLEVEIDIKADPTDSPPFNNGPNLYLRIANRRHRGVTTPFRQRSRGFIWFFSFLVWFDDVQHHRALQGGDKDRDLIVLLDEPGLSLHALAQRDFLRYIDDLSTRHQVLYTTHSPFMVHMDRLPQVRLVEDRPELGSVISDTNKASDPRTIFPLQMALGWTMAQSLFISERNLLVEGPADLLYLKTASAMLEHEGNGLRDDITIVPTGGLDKIATFIALLGGNSLQLAVLHDYSGSPEQRLVEMVKEKMIAARLVINAATYRSVPPNPNPIPTDLEDLLPVDTYLALFNAAFEKKIGSITSADLPPGDRIIDRLKRCLANKGLVLRKDGDFNHYLVAAEFARRPPELDAETLARFRALFADLNMLFT